MSLIAARRLVCPHPAPSPQLLNAQPRRTTSLSYSRQNDCTAPASAIPRRNAMTSRTSRRTATSSSSRTSSRSSPRSPSRSTPSRGHETGRRRGHGPSSTATPTRAGPSLSTTSGKSAGGRSRRRRSTIGARSVPAGKRGYCSTSASVEHTRSACSSTSSGAPRP